MDYKRLPYGIADFTWIQNQNRFLTDKTMFIPKMEEAGDFLYLIRPRRFGKSVFLTMIQAYYDIEKKDSFHTTFKDTWIEKQPQKNKVNIRYCSSTSLRQLPEKTDWRRTSMPIAKQC